MNMVPILPLDLEMMLKVINLAEINLILIDCCKIQIL